MCRLSLCLRAVLASKQCTAVHQSMKLIISLLYTNVKFTVFSVSSEPTQIFLIMVSQSCSEIQVQWELSDYAMETELWLLLIAEP